MLHERIKSLIRERRVGLVYSICFVKIAPDPGGARVLPSVRFLNPRERKRRKIPGTGFDIRAFSRAEPDYRLRHYPPVAPIANRAICSLIFA